MNNTYVSNYYGFILQSKKGEKNSMKEYVSPLAAVVLLEVNDIITASDPLNSENTYDVSDKNHWFVGE